MKKFYAIIFVILSLLVFVSCGTESDKVGNIKAFSVTFNGNGGNLVSGEELQKVTKASEIIAPVYENEGYTFKSWSKDISTITSDCVISAQWTKNDSYNKVTLDANGGVLTCESILNISHGTQITSISDPVKEGYTFDGWYYSGEKWSFKSDIVTIDLTLQAKWIINQYKLTIINYNNGINNYEVMYSYNELVNIQEPTTPGLICANWDKINNFNMPAHDVTIITEWDYDYEYITSNYIYFYSDGTKDFEVQSNIIFKNNPINLEWTSNSNSVIIEKSNVNDKFIVKIKKEDNEQNVKLVLHIGEYQKEYDLKIVALKVSDFANNYVFDKNNTIVYEDFELDNTYELWNKTCDIEWTSSNPGILNITQNKQAIVTPTFVQNEITLTAKFKYKGQETTKTYKTYVFIEMSNDELVNYWYTNAGITMTLSGYVLGIATVYNATYGNISLYMIDDSLKAGYYVYRGLCDQTTADKIVPGVHITVTGGTNTCYSGYWELNANTGTIAVDEGVEPIDPMSTVIDYDNELISNIPSYVYRQSTLIRLNGWKIIAKLAVPASGGSTNMLKIERDGVTINVATSKYCESYYKVSAADADPNYQAIIDKYNTLNVGDYVDVVGYLYARDGDIISVIGADGIIASSLKTESLGKEIRNIVNQISIPKEVNAATEINLLSSTDKVAISYRLNKNSAVAKIENKKLIITPNTNEVYVTLIISFTNGDFTKEAYYNIKIVLKS